MLRKHKVVIASFFVIGVGLLLYPTLACKWNDYRQQRIVEAYENHLVGDATDGAEVLGILLIPKIDMKLPIYAGTTDETLQKGAGLLLDHAALHQGEGSHAVLAGHRGLPTSELFTRLDELKVGDLFFIQIGEKKYKYRVDQVIPMIDKDDKKGMEQAFLPEDDKELVTLFTCTPYGVNTHRLLVRGVYEKEN